MESSFKKSMHGVLNILFMIFGRFRVYECFMSTANAQQSCSEIMQCSLLLSCFRDRTTHARMQMLWEMTSQTIIYDCSKRHVTTSLKDRERFGKLTFSSVTGHRLSL